MALQRTKENGLVAQRFIPKYSLTLENFDLREESAGIQRLFDLIAMLFCTPGPRVLFIDEIDRSLHPKLTVELVKLFYEQVEARKVQIIATTHESTLLDLKLLRRDEIWFIERRAGGSKMFSLDVFKVRYDKQIKQDYLLGRYGAVPSYGSLDSPQ